MDMNIFKFKKPHSDTDKTMTDNKSHTDEQLVEEFTENETVIENGDQAAAADPLQALQDEVANWKDKSYRLAAEMENLRRRAQREQEDAVKYGLSNAARQFLHVADNLERALASVTDRTELPEPVLNLLSGIEATQNELLGALGKLGVNAIPVKPGDVLDPQVHEVMFDTPSADHPPGRILYIMETGYKLHDRLLRPARVAVSKAPAAAPANGDNMDVSV
jgi:molecular chaperone GrpE